MISIIIPVYNAENEIQNCLDSILNFNSSDFEIIAIDDGSTDNSNQILKEYALKDNRMKVYSQVNQGNSKTRDNGIKLSTGNYIYFVDADDEIEPHSIDYLNKEINRMNPDILFFGFTIDFIEENYSKIRKYENLEYIDVKEAVTFLLFDGGFNLLWNKIYKASILKGYSDFPNMKSSGQDLIFNCNVFSRITTIQSSSKIIYHYKKRIKETMVSKYIQDAEGDLIKKENALINMLNNLNIGKCQTYYDYMIREYEVYLINLFSVNCPLSLNEKKKKIENTLFADEALRTIEKGKAVTSYLKIFKKIVLLKNADLVVIVYFMMSSFKNDFGGLYRKIRKVIYK